MSAAEKQRAKTKVMKGDDFVLLFEEMTGADQANSPLACHGLLQSDGSAVCKLRRAFFRQRLCLKVFLSVIPSGDG